MNWDNVFSRLQADQHLLVLRCLFSAPEGHRKIARGFQPLGPEDERGPGAGSPWLLTIAPVGARKPRNIKTGALGYCTPGPTRLIPHVTTVVRPWFKRDAGPPTSGISPIRAAA